MLVALNLLIEKTIQLDGHAVIVFIDYSEAFDCMHLSIIDVLNYIGHGRPISFPKHLVALREALYTDHSPVIFNLFHGVGGTAHGHPTGTKKRQSAAKLHGANSMN